MPKKQLIPGCLITLERDDELAGPMVVASVSRFGPLAALAVYDPASVTTDAFGETGPSVAGIVVIEDDDVIVVV